MREFSDFEKEIICELCSSSQNYGLLHLILINKIYSHQKEAYYILNDEVLFEGYYQDNDKINLLVVKIIGFYKLIEYLDKSYLLLTYKKKIINDNKILEPLEIKSGEKHMTYAINDYQIKELVSKYYNHAYIPSKELSLLVENNFKTQEQRHFLYIKKKTNISIGIAIVIGLIGILLNIIALCKATKLDISQLQQIEQTICKQKIPEVIKTKVTNDTLKVLKTPKSLKD